MGPIYSIPRDDEQETHQDSPHTTPRRVIPKTPAEATWAPRKRGVPVHYLFLDVQTTNDDEPQLLSLDAVLYEIEHGIPTKGESMGAIIQPRRPYSILRHMQDVRVHGIPVEVLSTKGRAAADVVRDLFDMITRGTGVDYIQDHDKLVVVGHSVEGMMSNLMAAARVDETLYNFWNELEVLCQHTHDTLDEALLVYPDRVNYSLEHLLAFLSLPLPENRAQAVADLYMATQDEMLSYDPVMID